MTYVIPVLGRASFSCPHLECSANSLQRWYKLLVTANNTEQPISVFDYRDRITVSNDRKMTDKQKNELLDYINKQLTRKPFFQNSDESMYGEQSLENVFISKCFSCNQISIWLHERLIYPKVDIKEKPNADMPEDIKRDFEEASSIVDLSPRGACALLRLVVQKLCLHLGGEGKNINDDIALLVKNGLNEKIQKSLDIVRVIGNEAVHPGELDLKDNVETAKTLFVIVNHIVDSQISQPIKIDLIYSILPESKLKQIEMRDAKK